MTVDAVKRTRLLARLQVTHHQIGATIDMATADQSCLSWCPSNAGTFQMRFVNPIPFVESIEVSKRFYQQLLGLKVIEDHGDFVRFEHGFALHVGRALEFTVWGDVAESRGGYGRRNLLLYFEHEDVDAAFSSIAPHVTLIHPVQRQSWGQRVFRFYDPDGHTIEIGEPEPPA